MWTYQFLPHSIHKKFELMLTRCTKAYSSFCSQTVSLFPAISSQFMLGEWAAAKNHKKSIKPLIFKVQNLSKSLMLIWLKSSSLVLVVIGSMLLAICNRFHERLANNGKITTFTGVPLFDALVRSFLEPKKSRLRTSKSTFNAENFNITSLLQAGLDLSGERSATRVLRLHSALFSTSIRSTRKSSMLYLRRRSTFFSVFPYHIVHVRLPPRFSWHNLPLSYITSSCLSQLILTQFALEMYLAARNCQKNP